MPRLGDRVFLATKTGERERDAAWAQINASLERLQVDRVDLIQLHAVGDLDDLDRATGTGRRARGGAAGAGRGAGRRRSASPGTAHEARPPTWRRCAGTRSTRC